MTTSIKDVAARAGVSAKTVSRVINGEAHVREAKREAVMQAVRELGYRPNAFARSLSSSRSYLLGLITDDPRSSYAADIQLGALRRCRERSYHLLVEEVDRADPAFAQRLAESLATLKLDGVILTPPLCDEASIMDVLDSAGVSYVRLSPRDCNDRSPLVKIDDFAAAADMTRYLASLGHRRIGFVKGDPAHSASAHRYEGYLDEMARLGLIVDHTIIAQGDFSARSGFACAERILLTTDRPPAIFASNDDMALGVLMAATKLRIDVPNQLAIAGFDDAPLARASWPQLTTIRQPNEEMAGQAVDALIENLSERAPDDQYGGTIELEYKLIARGSTKAA